MMLKFYKTGQGYHTRLWSAIFCFLVVAIGCYRLYQKLYSPDTIWLCTLLPGAICAVGGAVIVWMVNKPSVADFMIAAEGEIKKVSWSSSREIVASTTIVIVVVLLMGFMLVGVDFMFQALFRFLRVYPKMTG
jgi:preprotein translocase SecE subunit